MKKLFIFIFSLIYIISFSQSKIIKGRVLDNGAETADFKIYLLKEDKPNENGFLKFTSNYSPNFKFKLKKREIKKYNFLEIVVGKYNKVVRITDFKDGEILDVKINHAKIPEQNVIIVKKPAIYLYPQKESQIDVLHQFKGKITTTYPEYNKGWSLLVKPDGKIYNFEDKKFYNYLFWEGSMKFSKEHYQYKNGFYVYKKDYIKFLQEKLSVLALNNTEINDFIVYWLPEMNKYEKVFVHFWINDNIDNSSVLIVNPEPDTSIRVFMEFKEYDSSENKLPEQVLPILKREGFTLVEWGGSEINSQKIK